MILEYIPAKNMFEKVRINDILMSSVGITGNSLLHKFH